MPKIHHLQHRKEFPSYAACLGGLDASCPPCRDLGGLVEFDVADDAAGGVAGGVVGDVGDVVDDAIGVVVAVGNSYLMLFKDAILLEKSLEKSLRLISNDQFDFYDFYDF